MGMSYRLVCYTYQNRIRIRFSPDLYDRLRALPAGRYDGDGYEGHKEFVFPRMPEFAYLIHTTFSDINVEERWYDTDFGFLWKTGQRNALLRSLRKAQLDSSYPQLYKTEPWKHQREAYNYIQGLSAALFMEMGTGKSKVVIDYLANYPQIRHVLLVGPNRVIDYGEWERQFERHYPEEARRYDLLILTANREGSVPKRAERLYNYMQNEGQDEYYGLNVVQLNYESAWRKPLDGVLESIEWDLVVLDESHRIKAPGSKVSQFFSRLGEQVPQRLILTGTPMPNNPMDIYGQFRFLDKTVFGSSFERFKTEYAIYGGFENRVFQTLRDPEQFDQIIDLYSYRRRSDDVLDLPNVMDIPLRFELPPKALKHYDEMEKLFFTYVEDGIFDATNILVQLLRLQQIVNGFLPIYEETYDEEKDEWKRRIVGWEELHTAKRDFLKDLLMDIPKDAPVVVFANYHGDLDNIRKAAEHRDVGMRYGELSGRQDDYHKYVEGKIDLLAVQIAAGAEGLNELVRSRYGIFYSTGYSLGKYLQARARLHRPGQTQNVVFYHLHGADTIDETIFETLQHKESVVSRFMPRRGDLNEAEIEKIEVANLVGSV